MRRAVHEAKDCNHGFAVSATIPRLCDCRQVACHSSVSPNMLVRWGSRDADRDQAGTSAHPAATAPPQSISSLRSASSWTPTQGWGIAARALGLRTSRNNERIHLEDMRDRTDRIHGVVSCFDWMLFRNYLRSRAAERVADGSVRMIAPSVAILPNLNLLLSTPRVSLVPGLRPL